MREIEFYPITAKRDGGVFDRLLEVSGDRKATVETLVGEVRKLILEIHHQHEENLSLELIDMTSYQTDLDGWVLYIRQLRPEELELPEAERMMASVARIEISELELNGGKPKITFSEWLDDSGNVKGDNFGETKSVEPAEVILYLDYVLESGNARPKLIER